VDGLNKKILFLGAAVMALCRSIKVIEFNTLPDDGRIKIAYLDGSGETVHGNNVTNQVRDGVARTGDWNPAELPHGDYVVRIYAADFAGNVALSGRDPAIEIDGVLMAGPAGQSLY